VNRFILFIFSFSFVFNSFGQSPRADSLVKIFHSKYNTENKNNPASDTTFANYAHEITNLYLQTNDLYNAQKYNNLEKLFYEKLKLTYDNKNYLDRILYRCTYSTIGILEGKENYNGALDLCFTLLGSIDSVHHAKNLARTLDDIGYIYYQFGNYSKALHFYEKSSVIFERLGNKGDMGSANINLYGVHSALNNSAAALKYCLKAIECFKNSNSEKGLKAAYSNLALFYENINLDTALYYVSLSKKLNIPEEDYANLGIEDNTLGNIFLKKAKTENEPAKKKSLMDSSAKYLNLAKQTGESFGSNSLLKDCFRTFSLLETEKRNFEKALHYINLSNAHQDSLREEENRNAAFKSLLKFEFNRKEAAAKAEQEKKDAVAEAEKRKERLVLLLVCFVLLTVLFFAAFVFRSLKNTKKQKALIEIKNKEIEDKNKDILDSMRYARRIQNSLLPTEKYISRIIKTKKI